VRIVWKHLPLDMHVSAMGAHRAAVAAQMQGRFWEFHDKVFANQGSLDWPTYERYARELGLDMERFDQDRAAPETRRTIEADRAEAREIGVNATPTFFLNGRLLTGERSFDAFARAIDAELERLGVAAPRHPPAG
jgi:protein-disulfide isomerase